MVMVQIRNVPVELHRQLKARAALEGVTLSELALNELRRALERPSRQELLRRVAERARTTTGESSADAVRAERDTR